MSPHEYTQIQLFTMIQETLSAFGGKLDGIVNAIQELKVRSEEDNEHMGYRILISSAGTPRKEGAVARLTSKYGTISEGETNEHSQLLPTLH